jgi:hypothetical protein
MQTADFHYEPWDILELLKSSFSSGREKRGQAGCMDGNCLAVAS